MSHRERLDPEDPGSERPLRARAGEEDADVTLAARLLASARRHRVTPAQRQRVWEAVHDQPRSLLGALRLRPLPAVVALLLLGGATMASATIGRRTVVRLIERMATWTAAVPAAGDERRVRPPSAVRPPAPPSETPSVRAATTPSAPVGAGERPAAIVASPARAAPAGTDLAATTSRPVRQPDAPSPAAVIARDRPLPAGPADSAGPAPPSTAHPSSVGAATSTSAEHSTTAATAPLTRTPIDDDRGDGRSEEHAPAPPPVAAPRLGPDPAVAVQGRGREGSLEELPVYDAILANNGHDPGRAAALLDGYLALHPHGSIAEEALALRIEVALERRESRLAGLGARYLRAYPGGRFADLARFATRKSDGQ